MEHNSQQQLVKMANQIVTNSPEQDEEKAAAFLITHIQRFWAPSMTQSLADYICDNDTEPLPAVKTALQKMRGGL